MTVYVKVIAGQREKDIQVEMDSSFVDIVERAGFSIEESPFLCCALC